MSTDPVGNDFKARLQDLGDVSRLVIGTDDRVTRGVSGFGKYAAAWLRFTTPQKQNEKVWTRLQNAMLKKGVNDEVVGQLLARFEKTKPLSTRTAKQLLQLAEIEAKLQNPGQLSQRELAYCRCMQQLLKGAVNPDEAIPFIRNAAVSAERLFMQLDQRIKSGIDAMRSGKPLGEGFKTLEKEVNSYIKDLKALSSQCNALKNRLQLQKDKAKFNVVWALAQVLPRMQMAVSEVKKYALRGVSNPSPETLQKLTVCYQKEVEGHFKGYAGRKTLLQDEVIDKLDKLAEKENDGEVRSRLDLALHMVRAGQYDNAGKVLGSLIGSHPRLASLLENSVVHLAKLGAIEKAKAEEKSYVHSLCEQEENPTIRGALLKGLEAGHLGTKLEFTQMRDQIDGLLKRTDIYVEDDFEKQILKDLIQDGKIWTRQQYDKVRTRFEMRRFEIRQLDNPSLQKALIHCLQQGEIESHEDFERVKERTAGLFNRIGDLTKDGTVAKGLRNAVIEGRIVNEDQLQEALKTHSTLSQLQERNPQIYEVLHGYWANGELVSMSTFDERRDELLKAQKLAQQVEGYVGTYSDWIAVLKEKMAPSDDVLHEAIYRLCRAKMDGVEFADEQYDLIDYIMEVGSEREVR